VVSRSFPTSSKNLNSGFENGFDAAVERAELAIYGALRRPGNVGANANSYLKLLHPIQKYHGYNKRKDRSGESNDEQMSVDLGGSFTLLGPR